MLAFLWLDVFIVCMYVCYVSNKISVFSIQYSHTHTAGFTSTAQLTSSVTATGWHKQRKHSMVYYRRAAQTYWLISQHRSTLAYCYAALLPRRGPHTASHSVCLSVCLSVRPVLAYFRTSVTCFRQPCGRAVSFVLFTFQGRISYGHLGHTSLLITFLLTVQAYISEQLVHQIGYSDAPLILLTYQHIPMQYTQWFLVASCCLLYA